MRFILMFLTVFSLSAFAAPKAVTFSQIAPLNLTAAGTRQVMAAAPTLCTCAVINALVANTGVMYIGDNAVTATNGFVLQKGDTITLCSSDNITKVDLGKLWYDGGTTNDKLKVSCSSNASVAITPKPI